jgi:hypothetical protein
VAAGGLAPVAAGLAVGAGDLLAVPVDAELSEVKAVLVAGLPAGVWRQRADQLDAVVGAGVQDVVDADIAGVDEMLGGQQVGSCQVGVAAGDGVDVVGGRHGRCDVHDQVGPVGLAGLGEVGL